jgi:recombination protein RecA
MGDANVGLQARLMSQAMRKLTASVSKSHTCIVFINQIRMKIGVMFGNPETTTGGNALKFYATMRLDIRRIGAIKDGTTAVGNRTRVKVVKNKVAPPFREAEFDIIYGKGISFEGDLVDLAAEKGIVEKSGAWFSFGGERIGQGREAARTLLEENAEVRGRIERAVRQAYGLQVDTAAVERTPGTAIDKHTSERSGPERAAAVRSAEKPAERTSAEKTLAAAEKGK